LGRFLPLCYFPGGPCGAEVQRRALLGNVFRSVAGQHGLKHVVWPGGRCGMWCATPSASRAGACTGSAAVGNPVGLAVWVFVLLTCLQRRVLGGDCVSGPVFGCVDVVFDSWKGALSSQKVATLGLIISSAGHTGGVRRSPFCPYWGA
jgi:hypothetical protein